MLITPLLLVLEVFSVKPTYRKSWAGNLLMCSVVLGIGLKNQNRLIGNSEQSIIDYNRFSACFVRKTEYSFLPNIITVVFR